MSPSSRPPLTSRIRASFEGKRKSEVTSPIGTNDFVTQDPALFRNAIDAAINSAEFQNAIAANLARIINPSIKDALDTLQPLVESVYSHEVLLRKTNRSVENILQRIDTQASRNGEITPKTPGSPGTPTTPQRGSGDSSSPQDIEHFRQSLEKSNKRTVATLAELSNAVDTNNKKIEEVVLGIGELQATLKPTKDNLESIKSSCEQSTTTTAVVQAQLDQLQADVGFVIEAVGTDLGKKVNNINQQVAGHPALLADHATKLDVISTDLVALKGQADISDKVQAIAVDLEENFAALGSQVGSVLKEVETHGGNLIAIKDASANPELLAAVQQSNESHASHAVLLGEIKERSLQPGSEPGAVASAPLPGDNTESLAALETLKTDLAALGEKIDAELVSHNNNLAGLGSKVDNVLSTVEGHKAADQGAEILAAVQKSHELHASHAEALQGVKSIGAEAPAAPSYDTNFAALEARIATLHATMDSHAATLDEIKTASTSTSGEFVPAEDNSNNIGELQSKITTIMTKLDKHTDLLHELKDDVSAEILTALHDVGTTQASHSTLLTELREADVSDEILTALHASNDAHSGHNTALGKLEAAVQASNDSHTTHKASLEDIKFRSEESAPAAERGYSSAVEAQITALGATLEQHKVILAEINNATSASNESHAAHATTLDELKSRSVEAPPATIANTEALEAQITPITAALEEHKATLAGIKAATDSLKEFHAAQASSLDDIKSRSVEAGSAGSGDTEALKTQISTVITSLEEHNAALAEIKDATASSKEFHTTHASTLDEIKAAALAAKESLASHKATLAELKTVQLRELPGADDPPTPDISALEEHFTSIISTLEAQNVTLAEINKSNATGDIFTSLNRNHELTAKSHDLITSHTILLDSIKAETSHADILSSISELKTTVEESKSGVDAHGALVKDLHEETKSSHSALTTSIGALSLGGAAGASAAALVSSTDDISAEILEEVKAVRTLIETSSASANTTNETVTSIASQIEINHTTVTTSITTLNDELKAEIDATGTQLTESLASLNGKVEAIDISIVNSTVDSCTTEFKALSASIETLGGYIHSEGVHFNDKGVGQLKTYASSGERRSLMSESAWFGKANAAREEPVVEEAPLEPENPTEEDPEHYAKQPKSEDLPVEESIIEAALPAEEPEKEAEEEIPAIEEPVVPEEPVPQAIPVVEAEPVLPEPEETRTSDTFENQEEINEATPVSESTIPDVDEESGVVDKEPSSGRKETTEITQIPEPIPDVEKEPPIVANETLPEPILDSTLEVAEEPILEVKQPRESSSVDNEPPANPESTSTAASEPEESPLPSPKGKSRVSSPPPPITPIAHEVDTGDVASPSPPLSVGGDTEAESASTSTLASPSGPLSPTAPFSPDSGGGGGKKAKKGKKEKKEKAPKKKKEKIPFTFDGEDPEE